jgi:manganese/iron transport system permease protein
MAAALLEIALLSVLAGTLGVWVLLRRLAFFTHAVGASTFPGLVAASRWGLPAGAGALGAASMFALAQRALTSRGAVDPGTATAALLVGALAVGAAIVPGEHHVHEADGEAALFGALGSVGWGQVLATTLLVIVVVGVEARLRRAWTAQTFDPESARALGAARVADTALLVLAAATVVVLVEIVGALLAGVLLVAPAASARLLTDQLPRMRVLAGALALGQGAVAVVVADAAGVDAAPVLAVLAGGVHALVAGVTSVVRPAVAA